MNKVLLLLTFSFSTYGYFTAYPATKHNLKELQENQIPCNPAILEAIDQLPEGGAYTFGSPMLEGMKAGIGDGTQIDVSKAIPSICTSATFVANAKALEIMKERNQLQITPEKLK